MDFGGTLLSGHGTRFAAALPGQNDPTPGDLLVELTEACGADPARLCRWVYEETDNKALATLADWALDKPFRIIVILFVALLLSRLVRRAIALLNERLTHPEATERMLDMRRGRAGRLLLEEEESMRAAARAKTLTTVLSSVATVVIWMIAGLMVLGEVGISLAPLIAGAGIAGIAVGFGAQSIVKDFLSGFFMLLEDQYGLGDVVDVGEVTGTVESMSLRTTSLRDVNGALWHVPNGEISRVGNKSQLWSRAVLDIEVGYDTDLRMAQGLIQRVADGLWRDGSFTGGDIIEPPEVWGVEKLGADGVAIRLVVKTDPAEQWAIGRELRLRIKEAFDENGIEIPFPQRVVWIRQEEVVDARPPEQVDTAPVRRRSADDILPEDPAVDAG